MNVRTLIAYGVIISFAAFLLFHNLSDRLLWDDEAETALLAENINKFGVPKSTDGKNSIVLFGYESNEDDVWIWSPWLDEYITAASFSLFGKSTFSARFPFVLHA